MGINGCYFPAICRVCLIIAASSIPGGYYSGRLTSLKKLASELTYGTLNFMNIYLLKVNSVHLSSAKHICPNS